MLNITFETFCYYIYLNQTLLDMDLLQRLSEITNTRKEKVFRKTVSLKNFVNKYALRKWLYYDK